MSYKNIPANVVSLLLKIISTGRGISRLDDLEDLVSALRIVRPNLVQLDIFEAWFQMRHKHWQEALRLLQSIEARHGYFPLRTALQACCLYAVGDPNWTHYAAQALEQKDDTEAIRIAKVLMQTARAASDTEPELSLATTATMSSKVNEAWLNPYYLHV